MGLLSCPVCHAGFLTDVNELHQQIASALSRSLPCPICSENFIGLSSLNVHLATHFSLDQILAKQLPPRTSVNQMNNSMNQSMYTMKEGYFTNQDDSVENKQELYSTYHDKTLDVKTGGECYQNNCESSAFNSIQLLKKLAVSAFSQRNRELVIGKDGEAVSLIDSYSELDNHKEITYAADIKVSNPEVIPSLEKLDIRDEHLTLEKSPPLNIFDKMLSSPTSPASMYIDNISRTSSRCSVSDDNKTSKESSLPSQSPRDHQSCDKCGLVFSSEHFLQLHKDIIHRHSDCFEVSCKICAEKFKDLESYRNHVRENHTDRRYLCDDCTKTFKLKGSLMVHRRMYHSGSPSICRTCNKRFPSQTRMEFHERRYHGSSGKSTLKGKFTTVCSTALQTEAKKSGGNSPEKPNDLQDARQSLESLIEITRKDDNVTNEICVKEQNNIKGLESFSGQKEIHAQENSQLRAEHLAAQINIINTLSSSNFKDAVKNINYRNNERQSLHDNMSSSCKSLCNANTNEVPYCKLDKPSLHSSNLNVKQVNSRNKKNQDQVTFPFPTCAKASEISIDVSTVHSPILMDEGAKIKIPLIDKRLHDNSQNQIVMPDLSINTDTLIHHPSFNQSMDTEGRGKSSSIQMFDHVIPFPERGELIQMPIKCFPTEISANNLNHAGSAVRSDELVSSADSRVEVIFSA